ncbi:MAG: CapA family protein [Aeromicrobium sp.]|uniref:CapA family protein n=1 Tax=Aeromicrobium sp. TaxID=1871063 RepID=UPI0039E35151
MRNLIRIGAVVIVILVAARVVFGLTTADTTNSPEPGAADASPEPVSLVIGAAGDILPHSPLINQARGYAGGGPDDYDFSPMFTDVAGLLGAADLTLCHLEAPMSAEASAMAASAGLTFDSPPQLAQALAGAGYGGCDFASNHTLDQGVSGLADTQTAVEAAGLRYVGPTARQEQSGQPALYEVDGLSIAHLAYSYTVGNHTARPNTDVPDEAPWLADNLWPAVGAQGIIADAQEARDAGADFVIAAMHWGEEYRTEPTDEQRQIAREVLESSAVDLILGTHVHVIQPCEKINGRYVFYGLGNFLSNQAPSTANSLKPETQEGMITHVTLTRDGDGEVTSSATVQPTRVRIADHVIQLATPEQHPETFQRTMSTLSLLGESSCDAQPMS